MHAISAVRYRPISAAIGLQSEVVGPEELLGDGLVEASSVVHCQSAYDGGRRDRALTQL